MEGGHRVDGVGFDAHEALLTGRVAAIIRRD
jgi:hypothetical protein